MHRVFERGGGAPRHLTDLAIAQESADNFGQQSDGEISRGLGQRHCRCVEPFC